MREPALTGRALGKFRTATGRVQRTPDSRRQQFAHKGISPWIPPSVVLTGEHYSAGPTARGASGRHDQRTWLRPRESRASQVVFRKIYETFETSSSTRAR